MSNHLSCQVHCSSTVTISSYRVNEHLLVG